MQSVHIDIHPCSSAVQSIGLLSRGSQVRILPGVPFHFGTGSAPCLELEDPPDLYYKLPVTNYQLKIQRTAGVIHRTHRCHPWQTQITSRIYPQSTQSADETHRMFILSFATANEKRTLSVPAYIAARSAAGRSIQSVVCVLLWIILLCMFPLPSVCSVDYLFFSVSPPNRR